jgi:hypothetical protein
VRATQATTVLVVLALAGCASMSPEERAAATRVRIVKDADAVRGCQALGSVTDDEIPDLQKKAARLGGDVALVTLQTQRAGGAYAGFRFGTYTTAEVYRCAGSGR